MSWLSRNRATLRDLAEDALRTLRWRYLEALYGQTAIGVLEGVVIVPHPTRALLSLTHRSWDTRLLVCSQGQGIELRYGATLINTNGQLTVARVDSVDWALSVYGNVSDLTALRAAMDQGHRVTIHFHEAQ